MLKGLKIRSAGGAANSWRVKFAGGIANTTAWPNVPLSLSQGTFDALISSDESVNSAKLWEAGVKFSYCDNQFLAQYIPMVSNATWEKLSKAHQTLMTDLWASHIDGYDKGSIASQARARGILEKNGVTFHDASASELATTRKAMIGAAGSLIKDAKLSPELVKLVKEAVGYVVPTGARSAEWRDLLVHKRPPIRRRRSLHYASLRSGRRSCKVRRDLLHEALHLLLHHARAASGRS